MEPWLKQTNKSPKTYEGKAAINSGAASSSIMQRNVLCSPTLWLQVQDDYSWRPGHAWSYFS